MANIDENEMVTKMGGRFRFEVFRLRWMKACVRLNKHSSNTALIPEAEKRVEEIIMGGEF